MHLAHCRNAAKTWKIGIWYAKYQTDEASWYQRLVILKGGLDHDCYCAAPLCWPAFAIFPHLGCGLGVLDEDRGDPEAQWLG
jgi:hypothetical protein